MFPFRLEWESDVSNMIIKETNVYKRTSGVNPHSGERIQTWTRISMEDEAVRASVNIPAFHSTELNTMFRTENWMITATVDE